MKLPIFPAWVLPAGAALLAAVLTWFITYTLCDWSKTRALDAQRADMIEKHVQANQLSETISNDTRNQLATSRSDLRAAKRLYNNQCVRLASPSGRDAGRDQAGLHRSDEGDAGQSIGTDEFFDYSGDSNECAIRFNACARTLDAIYCRAGQKEYCR